MKKFESIYIDGLEDFINEKLTPRPFPIFFEMEDFAKKFKFISSLTRSLPFHCHGYDNAPLTFLVNNGEA